MTTLKYFVVILSILIGAAFSLDENGVKEKKCFDPESSSVELDYGWVCIFILYHPDT